MSDKSSKPLPLMKLVKSYDPLVFLSLFQISQILYAKSRNASFQEAFDLLSKAKQKNILTYLKTIGSSKEQLESLYEQLDPDLKLQILERLGRSKEFAELVASPLLHEIFQSQAPHADSVLEIGKGLAPLTLLNQKTGNQVWIAELSKNLQPLLELSQKLMDQDEKQVKENLLSLSVKPEYDLVLADLPFGIRLGIDQKIEEDKEETISQDIFSSTKLEGPLLLKAINAAKEGGTILASVPLSFLYERATQKFRKQLVNQGLLKKVILLPSGVKNATSVQSALLVLKKDHKKEPVQFLDVSRYEISKSSPVEGNREFIAAIQKPLKKQIRTISAKKLEENGFNLNLSHYQGLELVSRMPDSILMKDAFEIIPGIQKPEEVENPDQEIRLITLQNVDDDGIVSLESEKFVDPSEKRVERCLIKEGDILMTSNGSTIRFGLVEGINKGMYVPAHGLTILRSRGLSPYYLMAYLNSKDGREYFQSKAPGTRVIHFTRKDLENIPIPLLKEETQKELADSFKENLHKLKGIKETFTEIKNLNNSLFAAHMKVGPGKRS